MNELYFDELVEEVVATLKKGWKQIYFVPGLLFVYNILTLDHGRYVERIANTGGSFLLEDVSVYRDWILYVILFLLSVMFVVVVTHHIKTQDRMNVGRIILAVIRKVPRYFIWVVLLTLCALTAMLFIIMMVTSFSGLAVTFGILFGMVALMGWFAILMRYVMLPFILCLERESNPFGRTAELYHVNSKWIIRYMMITFGVITVYFINGMIVSDIRSAFFYYVGMSWTALLTLVLIPVHLVTGYVIYQHVAKEAAAEAVSVHEGIIIRTEDGHLIQMDVEDLLEDEEEKQQERGKR